MTTGTTDVGSLADLWAASVNDLPVETVAQLASAVHRLIAAVRLSCVVAGEGPTV